MELINVCKYMIEVITIGSLHAVLNDHELDLKTTMMYCHNDYVDAIRLVSEGKIQLKPLMRKHFKFKDYIEAYHYIDANGEKTMKVLIDVDI